MIQIKCLSLLAIVTICITKCYTSDEGKIWVLLVAGSNEYSNYRHQSDVYHAYQIVKSRGIPDENIIVMHYDDIANNRRNPKKGQVFNKPNGPNVYDHIPKDYTGSQLTPDNFFNVLSGNKEEMKNIGTGRVIESTSKDNIFVFYSDHGGPGIIAMVEEMVYANDFIETLTGMTNDQKYAKIALFIEACYSGSMFKNILPSNTSIYAMTAANENESSYARYYDKKVKAYLGDEYSTILLELLESGIDYSINDLYEKVKASVEGSHVEQYGDLSVAKKSVSSFVGGKTVRSNPRHHHRSHHTRNSEEIVPTLQVPIALLEKRIESASSHEEKQYYRKEIKTIWEKRRTVDEILRNILMDACEEDTERYQLIKRSNFSITVDNMRCAKTITKEFHEKCFQIPKNPYVIRAIEDLVKLCDFEWSVEEKSIEIIGNVCEDYDSRPIDVV